MAAVFDGSIPAQRFETIRDNIVTILSAEFADQFAKDSSYPAITRVYAERFIPINSDTETPLINVSIARGDWSNKTAVKSDGTYVYNIDIYTAAPSNGTDGPGDQYAMVLMTKIAGMVRAILSHPAYKRCGLPNGVVSGLPVVERFVVGDKSNVQDALSDVVGRIQYRIGAIETQEVSNSEAVTLEIASTTITLDESDKGFYLEATPND